MVKKALLLVLLVGCQPEGLTPVGERPKTWQEYDISSFEYKAHKYIEFLPNSRHGCTVLHDPNCPCLRRGEVDY